LYVPLFNCFDLCLCFPLVCTLFNCIYLCVCFPLVCTFAQLFLSVRVFSSCMYLCSIVFICACVFFLFVHLQKKTTEQRYIQEENTRIDKNNWTKVHTRGKQAYRLNNWANVQTRRKHTHR
jgi:Ca2+/Na+ antiporter